MAAGTILTVLSNIPWGAVVENAPKVADGASKLWSSVARWNKTQAIHSPSTDEAGEAAVSEVVLLSNRLAAAEECIRNLNEQMQASSTLIKELAEQNTLLVQRIELTGMRLKRYAVAGAIICLTAIGLSTFAILSR